MIATETIVPRATLDTVDGWLAPDGKLWDCSKWDHADVAEPLCRRYYRNERFNPFEPGSAHRLLEKHSWCKIAQREWGTPNVMPFWRGEMTWGKITDAQRRTLEAWIAKHKLTLPFEEMLFAIAV